MDSTLKLCLAREYSSFASSPLSTLKILENQGLPGWKYYRNYQVAFQSAISFSALQVYQEKKYPFSKTEEAIYNFYIGDQPASLKLLQWLIFYEETPVLQVCYYALRASLACLNPIA